MSLLHSPEDNTTGADVSFSNEPPYSIPLNPHFVTVIVLYNLHVKVVANFFTWFHNLDMHLSTIFKLILWNFTSFNLLKIKSFDISRIGCTVKRLKCFNRGK